MKLPDKLEAPTTLWERLAIAVFAALVGAVTALAFCCIALLVVGPQAVVTEYGPEGVSRLFGRVIECVTLASGVLGFFAPNAFIEGIGMIWDATYSLFSRLPRG